MMGLNFLDWNDLLAQHFFNERMAGREVILFANSELIESLGKPHGADFSDFVQKLKDGPFFVPEPYEDIYQMANNTYKHWIKNSSIYPPYIAYLVLFVCAATVKGDFEDIAYYPRLNKLLKEEKKYPRPQTGEMKYLWDDLEKWSKEIKGEELGKFTKRIRGGKVHIGIPLSQIIISEKERANLPRFFSLADLDPRDLPSDETLKIKLKEYGSTCFQKRTIALLSSLKAEDKYLSEALLDFVLEELENWDGKTSNIIVERHNEPVLNLEEYTGFTKVYFRICLDREFTRLLCFLRIKTKEEYPDDGLEFKLKGNEKVFACNGTNKPEWSWRLVEQVNEDTVVVDALLFDWRKGFELRDDDNRWLAKMRPSDVRVFLPGSFEGLDEEWVESQHLEYGCKFLIACHNSCCNEIIEWGQNNIELFEEKRADGLPAHWSLFFGKNAFNSCSKYAALSLPQEVRVRLKGGVKIGKGNQYLNFAPPYFYLEGARGDEHVTVDGIEVFVNSKEDIQKYTLPEGLEIGKTLTIEITKNGEKICNNRSIKLIAPFLTEDVSKVPKRDKFGDIIERTQKPSIYAQGAVVYGYEPTTHVPIGLPTYLSHRIIFLGSVPGQIVNWPDDKLPTDWNPVWAIAKFRQKLEVHFCGAREDLDKLPLATEKTENKKKTKKWSEYIWAMRKKVKDPELSPLRDLWSKYKEVARDVRS